MSARQPTWRQPAETSPQSAARLSSSVGFSLLRMYRWSQMISHLRTQAAAADQRTLSPWPFARPRS
eukprot:9911070-Alexandrium_andersonii.AAC.1